MWKKHLQNAVMAFLLPSGGLRVTWNMPDFLTFLGNLTMSKISPKVMAYLKGVVSHLSWLKIHQTKITTYDYHHLKGFQDRSTYTRYTGYLLFAMNPE